MVLEFFVPLLAMFTMLAVIVMAMRSEKKLEKRRKDPNVGPSSLASEADPHHKPD